MKQDKFTLLLRRKEVSLNYYNIQQQQQQQFYFKLSIAYKACAPSEGYSRQVQEKKENSINIYINIIYYMAMSQEDWKQTNSRT